MACAPQAIMLSANSCRSFFNSKYYHKDLNKSKDSVSLFRVRASSTDEECNVEECAPDKEVGKVSMEWLANEKTKVAGTFPPRNRGWTGYVEKDTAGQTNIYSIEPTIYVAESAISSGSAGSSSDGVQNTAAITAGIALITLAAASSLLLQVNKNPPPKIQTVEYSGPSLSYYINKFKPPEIIIEASVSSESETSTSVESETSVPEVSSFQVESGTNTPEVSSIQVESGTTVLESSGVQVQVESTVDVTLGN